ncbi:FMN-binding protein [Mesorhizobium sp. CCNWLW179-1]|uniref:FMN-binding protein n=1 Tax=unclassified Mesorhizobium TaxID=325217 RepID=UPI003015251C
MKQIALSLFVIAASGAYVWEQAGKSPTDDFLGSALPANAAEESSLPPAASPALTPARSTPMPLPEFGREGEKLEPRLIRLPAVSKETMSGIASTAARPATRKEQVSRAVAPVPEPSTTETVAAPTREASPFAITPAVYIPIPLPRPGHPEASARVIRAGMKLAAHGYTDGVYTGPAADAYYGIIRLQALIQGGRLSALKVLKYPSDRRTSISINRQALPMLRDEALSAQSANVDIITGATLTSRAFIQSLGGALKKASS